MRKLKVGDVLTRVKKSITIEDHQKYKRVTIKMKHQGVFLRDIEIGAEIGTKNQFLIREGQFLLSKIDARNGAFGIVPPEADGAIITGNFWAFDVNQKELNIDLFHIMTSLPFFDELSKRASSGTTNRQYLDEKKFLAQEITIPSIEEQDAFIAHFKKLQSAQEQTLAELQTQSDLIAKLRASILSDAVSGRLVPQDPNDEPANVLLEKIRAEKERLIKEGKIKREKPFSPIAEGEIPYELPKGWTWCRLDLLFQFLNGDRSEKYPSGVDIKENGIPFINSKTIVDNVIDFGSEHMQYISFEKFESLNGGKAINNDLIMVLRGASRGKVGMFLPNEEYSTAFINAQLLIIRSVYCINTKYILLYFNSGIFAKSINAISGGSAQPHISAQDLKTLPISLPPLAEQHRIVSKVEQLMATCDALEAEVVKSRTETNRLMSTILKEAFE